jgi:hypothetical protein
VSAVATEAGVAAKYAEQCAQLTELLDAGLEQLREMAERRKALAYDVAAGSGGQHELEALERQMAAKTTETDRLRLSIDELASREAREQQAAELARKQALKRGLDKALTALAKAGAQVADLVIALGAAVETARGIETQAGALADQLDLCLAEPDVLAMLWGALYEHGIDGDALLLAGVNKLGINRAKAKISAEPTPCERLRAKRTTTAAHHYEDPWRAMMQQGPD